MRLNRENTLLIVMSILPIALITFLIFTKSVNVPSWDQWALVPLFDKFYSGTLTLKDLWTQHNEHRILFPKIIMLILGSLTHWNIFYELITNLLIAIATYLVILSQMKFTAVKIEKKPHWILYLSIPILLFTTGQWENWSWGFQIQIFLNVAAVMNGLVLLTRKLTPLKLVFIFICGTVATYSFANGIMFWLIGLIIIVFALKPIKNKILLYFLWISISLVNVFTYFYHYKKPEGHPPLIYVIKHPLTFIKYFLAYIGSPMGGFDKNIALLLGFIGTVLFLIIFICIILRKRDLLLDLSPWLGAMLYSVISAVVSAVGRAGFGYEQALASRYVTISIIFWIGLVYLLFFFYSFASFSVFKGITYQKIVISIVSFLFAFTVLEYASGIHSWGNKYNELLPAQSNLISGCNEDLLKKLFPDPNYIKGNIGTLKNNNLSVFYKQKKLEDYRQLPTSREYGFVDSIQGSISNKETSQNSCIQVTGWAISAKQKKSASKVIVVANQKIIATSSTGALRSDVGNHFGISNYNNSGYTVYVNAKDLQIGSNDLHIYAANSDDEVVEFSSFEVNVIPEINKSKD